MHSSFGVLKSKITPAYAVPCGLPTPEALHAYAGVCMRKRRCVHEKGACKASDAEAEGVPLVLSLLWVIPFA